MSKAIDRLSKQLTPVPDGNYLLGFSGGADSTALMLMLIPAVRQGSIRLQAVHVNHGLRGQESDEDERFCREMCERFGIPLRVFRADLKGRRDEAAAREARYAFFRCVYQEIRADGLILAHHADDQAETFLMRLTRGTGPDGLECMKSEEMVNGIRIFRPMLKIRRETVREALRNDRMTWREDSSNSETAYLRNRIRQEIIPALERISETSVDKICRTAGMIGADNDALNGEAVRLLQVLSRGRLLNAETLAGESFAIRRRVLRMWWHAEGPVLDEHMLSAVQTEALEGLLDTSDGKINLPGGFHAVRTGKFLILQGEGYEQPDPVPFEGKDTDFGEFRLTVSPTEGAPGDGKRTQEVPRTFLRDCEIRTRRPGDRIRPFGFAGSKKLQDYLTDRRIGEPFRDWIPLLCRGNEVLLVGGVGAGNVPVWKREDDPVRLTWHGEMPWSE